MKHMSYRKRTMLAGYAFAAPGMIFALLYMGYPMVRSFYLSFTRYNFAFDPKPTFAGLQNYIDMFSDSYFIDALRNTAVFSLAFFPSLMIISLIIALLLDRGLRGSVFDRYHFPVDFQQPVWTVKLCFKPGFRTGLLDAQLAW